MMKRGSVRVVNIMNNANDEGRITHSGQHNEEGMTNHCIQRNAKSDGTLSLVTSAS